MRYAKIGAALCAAVLLLSASARAAEPAKKRPNILFIYTDDQSYRTVGCYPESPDWVRTPNIDALAKSGIRFTHAYIGTWCMPSRATLLTGHHPYAIESMRMEGKYPGSTYDPEQCKFWPKVFRDNGYTTAQIGKWHTGTDTGAKRDWDYQVVWNRPAHPDNATSYYYDQLISTDGGKSELVKGYSTDNYTEWAVDFINGKHRAADKPWYLWLCYGAVHGPYTPADRHKKEHAGSKVPVPADIYPPRPSKPDYLHDYTMWEKGPNGEPVLKGSKSSKDLHDWVRQYQQGVLALDEGVGQLIAALKKSGQLDNTLVVFTSDQGFAWGQHGFRHKLGPYDANIRAPFIVSMPGTLPEGAVCKTPVGGADLVPTFFAFAGIKPPWEMHGHDLTPLLRNPNAEWAHPTLLALTGDKYGSATATIPGPKGRFNGLPWWVSLRQGKYKYIRTLEENNVEELYDLDADPEELTNLAVAGKHDDVVAKFRAATVAELRRTKAPFVDKLPAVKKK
ncbi:MAG: sulfatase [Gemmataceae bacterium]